MSGAKASADKTIVVVEDDQAVLDVLTKFLRSVGYRTRGFGSAEALIDGLDWSPEIDCIISDIRLPKADGIELIQSLRVRGVAVPVVLITGYGDIPLAVRAMKAGATDFLEKPFEPKELQAAVVMALTSPTYQAPGDSDARAALARLGRLTGRQRQIVELITNGLTSKEIALELGMSFRTVEAHRAAIMDKLDLGSLAELIKLIVRAQNSESGHPQLVSRPTKPDL
jgi:two-component system response regulator FixJ